MGNVADFGKGGGVELLGWTVSFLRVDLSRFLSLGGDPLLRLAGRFFVVKVGPVK